MLANSQYGDAAVREALGEFGISPEPLLIEQIRTYAELLELWGRKVNLTSVRSPSEVLRRHFGESLFGARLISEDAKALIDVGSGAGFPGLPIKMLRPALRVKLLEPNLKKAAFLGEVVRALELTDVSVLRVRAEDIELVESERADCITARAVGSLESLLAAAARLARRSGRLVLWLGSQDAALLQPSRQWLWEPPLAVPDSKNRVILAGRLR